MLALAEIFRAHGFAQRGHFAHEEDAFVG